MQIIIGKYIPADSWIHKLDPRTKIISLILLIVITFIVQDLISMGVFFLVTLIIILSSKIPFMSFVRGIAPLAFLMFFMVIFQIFFNKQGTLLYDFNMYFSWATIGIAFGVIVIYNLIKRFLKFRFIFFLITTGLVFYAFSFDLMNAMNVLKLEVYSNGLVFAVFLITRIIILVSLSSLLTLTTKPTDLNHGLELVMLPLKKIKVPTEEISMMISIALRFIPTLLDEANKIMKAQASRGVDFKEGSLRKKVVQIIALLIPMFIISFKRADELANAMEARGYYPGKKRTKLASFKFRLVDYGVMVFILLLIPGVIVFGL